MLSFMLIWRPGVLLYVLREENYTVKAKAVYKLRRGIRQEFKDIRNNSKVGKAMWKLVDKLQDRPDDLSDMDEEESQSKTRKKRKRAFSVNDDEDDVDYQTRPTKPRGTGRPRGRPRKSQPV